MKIKAILTKKYLLYFKIAISFSFSVLLL